MSRIVPRRLGMGPKNAELFVEGDVVYLRVLEDQAGVYHTWTLDDILTEDVEKLLPLLEKEIWPHTLAYEDPK